VNESAIIFNWDAKKRDFDLDAVKKPHTTFTNEVFNKQSLNTSEEFRRIMSVS